MPATFRDDLDADAERRWGARRNPTGSDERIRLAAALRAGRPATGVVVLSQFVEPDYALALLEGGAAGRAYLLKERIADMGQLGEPSGRWLAVAQ